jgi:hypothetical protein
VFNLLADQRDSNWFASLIPTLSARLAVYQALHKLFIG